MSKLTGYFDPSQREQRDLVRSGKKGAIAYIDCSNLLAKIHTIPKHQHLPLVILSSKSKQTLDLKDLAPKFTAFLQKPVRHYQLHN